MKLFCLISTELAQQTVFQLFGSLIGYMSPLALRVILAHVGPAGSKHGDTGGERQLFDIAKRCPLHIQMNDFPQLHYCLISIFILQVILISMLEQL
jgi:hypothetical protein